MNWYKNKISFKNKLLRLIWGFVWNVLARPFPRTLGNKWKIFLLNIFGARIHPNAVVYSSARIYQPWKLVMEDGSCLADQVDCYNVDTITLKKQAVVSQKSYLCTASHDIYSSDHALITAPITVEEQAWIAADAFVGMGVTIGKGAVVGARAAVFKNVEPWTIVGGNPAKIIKNRKRLDRL